MRAGPFPPPRLLPQADPALTFKSLDRNSNSVLDSDELDPHFLLETGYFTVPNYCSLDTDAQGIPTETFVQVHKPVFSHISSEGIARAVSLVDANGDGHLSKKECDVLLGFTDLRRFRAATHTAKYDTHSLSTSGHTIEEVKRGKVKGMQGEAYYKLKNKEL